MVDEPPGPSRASRCQVQENVQECNLNVQEKPGLDRGPPRGPTDFR
jgi:hypothetical protein